MKRLAISIAREVNESWLLHCRNLSRHEANFAGTEYDLDTQLETAGPEHIAGVYRDTT